MTRIGTDLFCSAMISVEIYGIFIIDTRCYDTDISA
ncbi:hypothetical protein NIASO_01380 [Niabella soli DSM 19437]|uniref:Uncharacterized protein n=1 Tax=Niabella soli DSM 19437 TaxID=929713 RepID=W0F202_9BACT|nr:hypothetical protein NIASO_01380 [Niabella soli DSM 19437]